MGSSPKSANGFSPGQSGRVTPKMKSLAWNIKKSEYPLDFESWSKATGATRRESLAHKTAWANDVLQVDSKTKFKDIKQAYPDKVDCVITVEEQLKYDFLIQGVDLLLQPGFPAVSVATGGAQ